MCDDFRKHVVDANPTITDIIAIHLWIEHLLLEWLSKAVPRPEALFKSRQRSFPQLVDLCLVHDLFGDDLAQVLRLVNAVRNKYAHRLSFEAANTEIERLLKCLSDMESPFFVSLLPGTESELLKALAAISGHIQFLERQWDASDPTGK